MVNKEKATAFKKTMAKIKHFKIETIIIQPQVL